SNIHISVSGRTNTRRCGLDDVCAAKESKQSPRLRGYLRQFCTRRYEWIAQASKFRYQIAMVGSHVRVEVLLPTAKNDVEYRLASEKWILQVLTCYFERR